MGEDAARRGLGEAALGVPVEVRGDAEAAAAEIADEGYGSERSVYQSLVPRKMEKKRTFLACMYEQMLITKNKISIKLFIGK